MKLLEWLLFWPHMKLMIMYWLMIPHFSGALYFYELLVQPCVSLVPQIVINLFNEWKEPCLKRDDFPTEAAERYQKQNESEASEELISSDESIEDNVGQKEDKDVEVTEENEDVEVTKENEDVEVTEKNEVAAIERVTPIESTLVQTGKSTETLTDMNVTSKSTPGYTEVPRKISLVQEERNMIIHRQKKCASSNELKEEVNIKQCDVHGLQINSKKIFQDTRSPLVCYICNVWCPSKDNLDAHLKEKKHLAHIQELADFVEVTEENEDVEVTEKNEVAAIERVTPIESTLAQTGKSTETLTDMNVTSKNTPGYTEVPRKISLVQEERNMIIHRQKKCASSNELKEEVNKKQCDVHGLQINSKKSFQDTRSPLVCYICNVWCPSKDNLDAHLKEKKHLARIQELADFVEVTEENEDVEVTEKNEVAAIESVTPTESTLVQTGKSTETLTDMNVTSKSTPGYIEVPRKSSLVQEERNMIIHRQRKCASNNGLKEEVNIKQCDVHGLQINSKKIVQDTQSPLLCYICNVWCPNKDSLDAHLKGKKHSAQIQELTDFVKGQHA